MADVDPVHAGHPFDNWLDVSLVPCEQPLTFDWLIGLGSFWKLLPDDRISGKRLSGSEFLQQACHRRGVHHVLERSVAALHSTYLYSDNLHVFRNAVPIPRTTAVLATPKKSSLFPRILPTTTAKFQYARRTPTIASQFQQCELGSMHDVHVQFLIRSWHRKFPYTISIRSGGLPFLQLGCTRQIF